MEQLTELQSAAANLEVNEYESCYFFRLGLPGVMKDELKIEIIDNELLVSNRKNAVKHTAAVKYNFIFPRGIDSELARSVFGRGVLNILVPKKEFIKQRNIEIEDEKTGVWNKLFHAEHWKQALEDPQAGSIHITIGNTRDRGECL